MNIPENQPDSAEDILILADCHIRKRTWSNFAKISDDAYHALTTILQTVDPLPEVLLIAGDWFDTDRPSTTDILKSAEFFSHFRTVLYIAGNHDRHCGEIFEALQETSKKVKGTTTFVDISKHNYVFTVRGCTTIFAGLPYIHDSKQFIEEYTQKVLAAKNNYPDANLTMVVHTNFEHLLGFEGAFHINLDQVKDIAADYPVTVIAGHVHTRDTSKYSDGSRTYVHSPGSLYPSTFADAVKEDKPAVSVYSCDDGDLASFAVPVRSYADITFSTYEELDKALHDIAANADKQGYPLPSLVRLHITADMMNSSITVPADIADKVVLQITTSTTEAQDVIINMAEGYSMAEAAREVLSAYGEDAEQLSEYAEALLESADPLDTLEEWLDFWGVMRTHATKGKKNVKAD